LLETGQFPNVERGNGGEYFNILKRIYQVFWCFLFRLLQLLTSHPGGGKCNCLG
jgi:hypothetical protein